MKTIIVYYSLEGNTEFLVKALAENIGAETLMLEPIKAQKTKGFSKFVWGGYQAVMKKKPDLKPYDFKASDYDRIIFASPVWAGTFAPPLRTFFEREDLIAKKVAFFFTHEGGKGKTKEHFEEILADNHILGALDLITGKTDKEENMKKLLHWASQLKG
ncbi:MAG: flavodoxin family protein [Clostridiales bacterium]|nr:flavodoxin family protein [Clostridiales bacterium]